MNPGPEVSDQRGDGCNINQTNGLSTNYDLLLALVWLFFVCLFSFWFVFCCCCGCFFFFFFLWGVPDWEQYCDYREISDLAVEAWREIEIQKKNSNSFNVTGYGLYVDTYLNLHSSRTKMKAHKGCLKRKLCENNARYSYVWLIKNIKHTVMISEIYLPCSQIQISTLFDII